MLIRNLIGSEWRLPEDSSSQPIYNPATGEVIEQVPLKEPRDVDAAVRAASGAFHKLVAHSCDGPRPLASSASGWRRG
jgi:acyl-CoA reductase-like NAD-dependent aldehyde dehydrogenase